MDKKKLMLLAGAMAVAIVTALTAKSLFTGAATPQADAAQQAPKGPKVLVAQRALPVGTIITADSIAFQQWPKDMVQDAYFIDGEANMQKLLGTVVRFPITAGQPVTQGALVAPGDRGFLAAALGPGMRAVTITVSQKTGVAGFVFPGDHVDLMLTQSIKGAGNSSDESQSLKATETILRNLRVLATDQSTETETDSGKTVVKTFRTVTLEATPRIAEKIAVADTVGTLSLSLRSIADNQSELDRAIASGTVKVPDGASKDEEARILKSAINRPIEGSTSFVTGGDVSRFQRRTMPRSGMETARVAAPAPAQDSFSMHSRGSEAPAVSMGPIVKVTRGKQTTDVQLGGGH